MKRMQRVASWILILVLTAGLSVPGALAELADGIYEATAPGMNGDITVHAVVFDGEILKITADHSESAEVGAPAIDELIRRVIDVQDPDVDIVTGATQTSEAFVEAMKAALTQAGWEEEDFEWEIIERWTPTPEPTPEPTPVPVAEISAPQIVFDNAVTGDNETALVSGDYIAAYWRVEGDVQGFRLKITDAAGTTIKQLVTSDTQYALKRSMLSERQTYTLTVTAIPANGTLEANGVSASARFAVYIAPTPEPEVTSGSGDEHAAQVYYVVNVQGAVNMRMAPATDSETIERVPLGAAVLSVSSADNAWMLVEYNGRQGYIRSDKLSPDMPQDAAVQFTAAPSEPAQESVLQTSEISDSWEQIIAAIEDGTAKQRYAVGATKALDLGALGIIHMQLAGFDLDERADGNGKASTTWIAVELLPEKHQMNEANTATGGWQYSDIRAYLHNTLLPTIPEAVQKKLIRVKKQQRDNIVGHYQTTEDLVWIPDRDELFGNNSLYYGLFGDSSEKRVKRYTGSAAWWWLRSAYSNISFYAVYANGGYTSANAVTSGGLALGFCL